MMSIRRGISSLLLLFIAVLLRCLKYNKAERVPFTCFQKEIDEFCQKLATKQMVSSDNSGIGGDKVVFLAWYSKHMVEIGENETVKYDKVIENIGNGYDNTTGKFTAPVSGIYAISVTLMGDTSNQMKVGIMKNDELLTILFSGTGDRPQASNTANLSLKKADTIWVQQRFGRFLCAYPNRPYNVFTGVLITPT